MNLKCKNCGKDFEVFISKFCRIECENEYHQKNHD